jgi:hypothetical protein
MSPIEKDPEREERIENEIIVDCYGEYEQAIGWWCYLEDRLQFPFKAKCIVQHSLSPLRTGEQIEVRKMAPQENCMSDMFVIVRWSDRTLGVPLSQLQGINVDADTQQAIEDWHYWKGRGHEF